MIVDFPQQSHWTGLLSEMELVPSVHPGVRCDAMQINGQLMQLTDNILTVMPMFLGVTDVRCFL